MQTAGLSAKGLVFVKELIAPLVEEVHVTVALPYVDEFLPVPMFSGLSLV